MDDKKRLFNKTYKKSIVALFSFTWIFFMFGCGTLSVVGGPQINYGNSSVYSQSDMDEAISIIENMFTEKAWKNCELHQITYGGDSECNYENLKWMNELEAANDNQLHFDEVIMFKTDFRSPMFGPGSTLNSNQEYTDFEWWMAREKGGDWKLMTFGY